jgi:hypothetical protein
MAECIGYDGKYNSARRIPLIKKNNNNLIWQITLEHTAETQLSV